jgi:SNF2 family DNA or RNA helicase
MFVYTDNTNNLAVIKCSYGEKELVKALGDYKFNKANSTWVFPLRKLVDIIDNLHIEYNEETKIIYDHLREERQKYHEKINLANKIKSGTCLVDNLDGIDLSMCYQHQKKAITLAAMFGSYALFLEPGLGKSLIAIKLIEYWKVPAMIVAPLSTLESVWINEIKKWSKLKPVILWHNLKEINNGYDVYVINYEQFRIIHERKIPIENKIRCLIIDESAKLKTHNSKITKAILNYKDEIPHRLILSGVPAPNNLLEYWAQMEFINEELLG